MAEERSQQASRAEQSEDQTLSSGNVLTSDDPRIVSGRFDDVVETVDELSQAVDDLPRGSQILFDEAGGSTSSRRDRAALGEDYALRRGTVPTNGTGGNPFDDDTGLGTSIGDPLDFTRSVSNRELEKRINAHGRRLKRVEERLDDVVDALDGLVDVLAADEQRPVGEVLQDVLDDEITQRQAAAELGWSQSKVAKVLQEIQTDE